MRTTAVFSFFLIGIMQVRGKTHYVDYDCNVTPGICANHCWAVNCMGHPESVHGGTNSKGQKVNADKNRQEWGYNTQGLQAWKQPPYDSPEEYPYASSKEGGISSGGIPVSLRMVPMSEQSTQSGKLSGIGTSPSSDRWTVMLTNVQEVYRQLGVDWCHSTTQCQNDGRQFYPQSKGVFALSTPAQGVQRIDVGQGSSKSSGSKSSAPVASSSGRSTRSGGGSSSNSNAPVIQQEELGNDGVTYGWDQYGQCYYYDVNTHGFQPLRRRTVQGTRAARATPAKSVGGKWRKSDRCPLRKGGPMKASATKQAAGAGKQQGVGAGKTPAPSSTKNPQTPGVGKKPATVSRR